MLNRRDFVRAASGLLVPGALTLARNPRGSVSGSALPAAVIAAGFTNQTFGPNLTLGGNWFFHNFYNGATSGATQNGNGISIDGTTTYGIASAHSTGGQSWAGTAFGGGGYFEATFSFPPSASPGSHYPAFWANDIEAMAPNAVTLAYQWPGQATGYGEWIEHDYFELDAGNVTQFGSALHSWYGTVPGASSTSTSSADIGNPLSIGSNSWVNPQSIGALWIPATVSSQGSYQTFVNRVPVGNAILWDLYDPTNSPPPVKGSSAYSIVDIRHMVCVLNTSLVCAPMLIYSMSVYQATAANNITGSLTLSSTSPLTGATHAVPYTNALSFSGGTGPYTGKVLANTLGN